MELPEELVYTEIGKMVFEYLESVSIDFEKIAAHKSIQVLN